MRLQYIYSTVLTQEEPGNKASQGGGVGQDHVQQLLLTGNKASIPVCE